MGKLKIYLHLLKSKATLPRNKMSATLFGSMTRAVKRAAVAAPVAAVAAAAASPPRRSMSGDGKTTDGKNQAGTVSSAGGSFAKKEKAEEARWAAKQLAKFKEMLKKKKETG